MLDVSVYIDGERLDLYEDETIQMVDSIQNLREPDKFFSAYTKEFAVPASKANNIIFRHFYNGDITNGFDARVRVDATIKVHGFDFKKGQVKLNHVTMKEAKAYSYHIVFYGETSKLKQIFRDLKLSGLSGLDVYDHDYSFANIKAGFQTGLGLSGGSMVAATGGVEPTIVYPFISHTKQYIYDSTASPPIYNISDPTEALDHTQLKPAIRFKELYEAIETTTGITFDWNGFLGTSIFEGLYLWMHKEKAGIQGVNSNISVFRSSDFTLTSGNEARQNGWFQSTATSLSFDFDVTITGTGSWDIVIKGDFFDTNAIVYEEKNISGSTTLSVTTPSWFFPVIEITSEGTISLIDIEMTYNGVGGATSVYDVAAIAPNDFFNAAYNMPDMKVLDFMTSMFKMFNLVIEQRDGVYYIETIDDYYAAGTQWDLDEYIDPSEFGVAASRPYDTLNFRFEEAESYLMVNRYELLQDRYGDDSYDLGNLFEDNDYDIEVGFEKILFEKMEDTGGSTDANLWAWCVDEDGDPYIGNAPIVFYWDGTTITSDIEWDSDASTTTTQPRTSNTVTDGLSSAWFTLGFKPEIDEYDQATVPSSLFGEYWSNYIEGVYDIQSRILTVDAYLTPGFMLNYSLADEILFKNRAYYINEINLDLNTGKASVELVTKWL